MTKELLTRCKDFNELYKLPISNIPSLEAIGQPVVSRLKAFKETLLKEVGEIDQIVEKIESGATDLEVLTDIADILGDIPVYCMSEAIKFGIPLDEVLEIIMDSNMSKQNPDGSTSYDENGKVMKGSRYWRPEPKISNLLNGYSDSAAQIRQDKVEDFKYLNQETAG